MKKIKSIHITGFDFIFILLTSILFISNIITMPVLIGIDILILLTVPIANILEKKEIAEWEEKVAVYYENVKDFTLEQIIDDHNILQSINDMSVNQLRRIIEENKDKDSVKTMKEAIEKNKGIE